MKIDTIITTLDTVLLKALQEDYDNSGPQIIFRGTDVQSILISLDIASSVLDEAVKRKCSLIVTHHPLFFNAVKQIDTNKSQSSMIVKIVDSRINVYSAHTNLDKLFFDRLAKTIGFDDIEFLFPNTDHSGIKPAGFGAIAYLERPLMMKDLLANVKNSLKLDFVVFTGDIGKKVTTIAFLNGAGGSSIEKIIQDTPADCIITGDVGYHHAKFAADHGTAVIDAGHFGTEIIMLGFLRDRILDCLTNEHGAADIPIYISEVEKNPFKIYGANNE